jgi:hypothetical protein
MLNKEEAKLKIIELVKEFSELTKDDCSTKSENQIKSEFIDPFFEALGWDMRKDAEREMQIRRGRSDYILRQGNKDVMIIDFDKFGKRIPHLMMPIQTPLEDFFDHICFPPRFTNNFPHTVMEHFHPSRISYMKLAA